MFDTLLRLYMAYEIDDEYLKRAVEMNWIDRSNMEEIIEYGKAHSRSTE